MMIAIETGKGHIFKKMRLAAGMTPQELADKIKYARSHIYRIETDETEPTLHLAKSWVIATGASVKTPALVVELLLPQEFLNHLRQKKREKNADNSE